jgi:L-2-hydroxyglutarate oxidase LhgO
MGRTMTSTERIGIVGAGILGLAVARRLLIERPGVHVTVLEKEAHVAAHQTGHNSGVAHAGLYYAEGSLKAQMCRRGTVMLKEYCDERGLVHDECGKLVVALDDREVTGLRDIQKRATANGVPDLRWLNSTEITELEPHVVGKAALHSPRTAIVDFPAITRAFADDVTGAGGEVRLGYEVTAISQLGDEVRISSGDETLTFDRAVLCGGLHADKLARMAGDVKGPLIIPFRGEYLRLRSERSGLVNGLIYPVPDPRYPFLGVHFTPRVNGFVDIGPNAVLATAREGYRKRDVRLGDLIQTVGWRGFRIMARAHWRTGITEMHGSLSQKAFLAGARRYVPGLTKDDVETAPAGVRAQAIDRDGTLVDDFRISHLDRIVAVRNAPSPAATSSLALAEHICRQLGDTA